MNILQEGLLLEPHFKSDLLLIQSHIAGIDRRLIYDRVASGAVVDQHRNIAAIFGVKDPYFNFTDRSEDLLFESALPGNVRLTVGPIGAYTAEQMAVMLQEQTVNYLIGNTMGLNFPKDYPSAVSELLSIMMGGFDPNRVVVLFEHITSEGSNPVSGVQGYFGGSDNLVGDVSIDPSVLNGDDGRAAPSTLGTFMALKITTPYEHPAREFLERYGSLSERELVGMSRLYRQDDETSRTLGIDTRGYGWVAMAALGMGIDAFRRRNIGPVEIPSIVVYDTHTRRIQGNLETDFGTELVALEGQTKPTEDVMATVLRYHYGPEAMGGYQEGIMIGFATLEEYVASSNRFLQAHGIDLKNPRN